MKEKRIKKWLNEIDKTWNKKEIEYGIAAIFDTNVAKKIENNNKIAAVLYDKALQEALFIKINNKNTKIFKI